MPSGGSTISVSQFGGSTGGGPVKPNYSHNMGGNSYQSNPMSGTVGAVGGATPSFLSQSDNMDGMAMRRKMNQLE